MAVDPGRRTGAVIGVMAMWAVASAIIVNVVLRFSLPIVQLTERCLAGDDGRVLDAGAGSEPGRRRP